MKTMGRVQKFQIDEGSILTIQKDESKENFFNEEEIKDSETFTEFIQLNFSLPQLLEDNIEIKIRLGYEDWKIFNTFDKSVLIDYGLRKI